MSNQLQPWQLDLIDGVTQGRELKIMMSGRKTGKSIWTNKAIERLMKDLMNRPIEDLVLNETRIQGARYYTVEPIGGNWLDMETWCIQTFGDAADVWDFRSSNDTFIWPENGRWYKNNRKFWFRDIKDRDWFLLKWRS